MKLLVKATSLLVLVGISFWAGSHFTRRAAAPEPAPPGRTILHYVDPMNPAHTSDRPGKAPCGMDMEPVYADATGGPDLASLPKGSVKISAEKQQLIGVRVATVEKKTLTHHLRLLGRVATDETRIYRINATVDGWITRTMPVAAGSLVRKHDVLAGFYSPEFLSAGQALIFALSSKDRVQQTGQESPGQKSQLAQFELNLRQYGDTLRNLGMGEMQIQEMIKTRKTIENVDITSPGDGVILQRSVSDGQRFERGTELFRIADLSRVWILADLFGRDAQLIQTGTVVHVSLPHHLKTYPATVSRALPQFDGVSRTLKVRLEADNPDLLLKPDMFVDVQLPITLPDTLVVPADAVLDSGLQSTIFVALDGGVFEPRRVQTGARYGEEVQILEGLAPGEKIAAAGTFLLDSESRMKLAVTGVHGASAVDAVHAAGMTKEPSPPSKPAKDLVCGMDVEEPEARAARLLSECNGTTFFFCAEGCKRRFDQNPERYLEKRSRAMPDAGSQIHEPMAVAK